MAQTHRSSSERNATRDARPINDVSTQYAGEWLLLRLLDATISSETPVEVLAHSSDWDEMAESEERARAKNPDDFLWLFAGGTIFGDGEGLRRGVAAACASGEWVSVNDW